MPASHYLSLFLDICLFRRGPQDVPASDTLLASCLLAYLAIGVAALLSMSAPLGHALLYGFSDLLAYGGITWLLLMVARRRQRFLQTFTAMLGSGALLSLVAWPVSTVEADESAIADIAGLLIWVVIIWSIAVTSHIVRHALDIRYSQAVALAMIYFITSVILSVVFAAQLGD